MTDILKIEEEILKREKKLFSKASEESDEKERMIFLKVNNTEDLFSSFDPSPLEKCTVKKEIEDYCLEKLEDIPFQSQVSVVIETEIKDEETRRKIAEGLKNHFKNMAKKQIRANRREERKWFLNFVAGLFFLGFCLVTAHILSLPHFDRYRLAKVIAESLGIIGWVAIWEPADYFLFDWKDDAVKLKNILRLHLADIKIK